MPTIVFFPLADWLREGSVAWSQAVPVVSSRDPGPQGFPHDPGAAAHDSSVEQRKAGLALLDGPNQGHQKRIKERKEKEQNEAEEQGQREKTTKKKRQVM